MDMTQSYFALFGIEPQFDIDTPQLDQRYRQLQREYHPDKHAHLSEREQRISVQASTHLNEAYRTLKSPFTRAQYLLQLAGVDVSDETRKQLPASFLMEQMELREAIAEVERADDPLAALEAVELQGRALESREFQQFAEALAAEELEAAEQAVRKLQFIEKLLKEIEAAEDRLDEEY